MPNSAGTDFAPFPAQPLTVMREKIKNKDLDDYKVAFSGTTISKNEAKKVRIALLFGMIAMVAIGFTFGITDKVTVFILSAIDSGDIIPI